MDTEWRDSRKHHCYHKWSSGRAGGGTASDTVIRDGGDSSSERTGGEHHAE